MSKFHSFSAQSVNKSHLCIHRSASFCFGPIHRPSLLHSPSSMPILPVWMVEGPIRLAEAMVKAHSSDLLILLCSSNSAARCPTSCTAACLPCRSPAAPLAIHKSHFFLKFLSKGRQSQCVHGSLPRFCPNPAKCQRSITDSITHCFSIPCRTLDTTRVTSATSKLVFDDFSFISRDLATSRIVFLSSLPSPQWYSMRFSVSSA